MNKNLQQLVMKFNALSQREKIIVVASAVIALLVGWFLLVSEPLTLKTKELRAQTESLNKEITELSNQIQNLQRRKSEDPHRELKQRLVQLDEHTARVDVELRNKFHGLIEPRQMANVLESVLKQHKNLVLVRVQSLDAVPLVMQHEDKANAPVQNTEATPQVEVYRHGMQVEFEGSYLATLEYLKTLEALPWEFYWDAVQLDVEDYPKARIIITVHTLSLRDAWIGV